MSTQCADPLAVAALSQVIRHEVNSPTITMPQGRSQPVVAAEPVAKKQRPNDIHLVVSTPEGRVLCEATLGPMWSTALARDLYRVAEAAAGAPLKLMVESADSHGLVPVKTQMLRTRQCR